MNATLGKNQNQTGAKVHMFIVVYRCGGDSGEAERSFRKESERHSGMNPNTIGA